MHRTPVAPVAMRPASPPLAKCPQPSEKAWSVASCWTQKKSSPERIPPTGGMETFNEPPRDQCNFTRKPSGLLVHPVCRGTCQRRENPLPSARTAPARRPERTTPPGRATFSKIASSEPSGGAAIAGAYARRCPTPPISQPTSSMAGRSGRGIARPTPRAKSSATRSAVRRRRLALA